ncbi:uncharacterized protein LOC143444962 [Clavelina lepadiformis]|uniref:uncharacterized protein LOC143444962 n=1 Tax=Clavelina lepadiformis TaxID=159417 RepID=UPI00404193FB
MGIRQFFIWRPQSLASIKHHQRSNNTNIITLSHYDVVPGDRDAAKAATLIQANYRGYKTRQSLTPNKAPEKDASRKEAIIDALLDTLQDDDSMTVESDDQIKSTESEKGQMKKVNGPNTLVDLQEVTATGCTILASLRIPRPKNSGENQKK